MVLRLTFYVLLILAGVAATIYAMNHWPGLFDKSGAGKTIVVEATAAGAGASIPVSDVRVSDEICAEIKKASPTSEEAAQLPQLAPLAEDGAVIDDVAARAEFVALAEAIANDPSAKTRLTCMLQEMRAKAE